MKYLWTMGLLTLVLSSPAWACSNPGTVWILQPTSVGWQWCPPGGGTPIPKTAALSKVDDADLSADGTAATVEAKYGGGTWVAWAAQQSARMQNLGFTTAGQYSYRYAGNRPVGGLFYTRVEDISGYSTLDSTFKGGLVTAHHVHNASYAPTANAVCSAPYAPTGADTITIDVYDPNAQTTMNQVWGQAFNADWSDNTKSTYDVPDEADHVYGYNQFSYHVDFGLMVLIGTPSITSSRQGYNYVTNGGSATVYVKQALASYLQTKYGTIAALNAAWGTSYTTFNTSDAGGLAGISNGTYTQTTWSAHTGTGLLDENGFHVINATQQSNCGGSGSNGPSTADNWATNAQIKTDVEAFVATMAAKYAQMQQIAQQAYCSTTCPPMMLPLYDGPTYVYTAMSPYASGFWIGFGVIQDNLTLAAAEARVQTIINATSLPVIVADYFNAPADSGDGGVCLGNSGAFCLATQAARATNWVSFYKAVLVMRNTAGKFAVVGLEHWAFYDKVTDVLHGLGFFSKNDNAYDGSQASTIAAAAAYATSHSYTQPAIITDGTNNESLYLPGTSGGSAPTWSTNYYGATVDNTAKWFDIGSYALIPEASNFGDAVGPIRDFLKAGIGDAPFGCSSTATIPPPTLAPFSGRTGAGTVVSNPEPSNFTNFGCFGLNNPIARVSDSNTSTGLCNVQGSPCPSQVNYSEAIDGGDGEDRNWSVDESQFVTINLGGASHVWNFNTSTMLATPCFSDFIGSGFAAAWVSGPTYSHITAKKVYSFSNVGHTAAGTILSSYSLTGSCPLSPSPTMVVDFNAGNGVPGTFTFQAEPVTVNDTDTIFGAAFSTSGTQNTATKVSVWKSGSGFSTYDTSTNTVIGDWGAVGAMICQNCPGAPISPGEYFIHNLKMDPTGTWAIITPVSCTTTCFFGGGEYVWQVGTLNLYRFVGNDSGHYVMGYTGTANEDNSPYWFWRTYGSSSVTQFPATGAYCGGNPPSIALDSHPSWWWNSGADQEPFLLSTVVNGGGNPTYSGCGVDEILFLYSPANTVNVGNVLRVAHTYCAAVSEFQGNQCLAEVSPQGHFALFDSPMANSSTFVGQLGDQSGAFPCTVVANCSTHVFVVQVQPLTAAAAVMPNPGVMMTENISLWDEVVRQILAGGFTR